ncbi:MAG: hypothetical protein KAW14_13145 [Candidatus Aegiribacteria sp.]|nr:hypothetical protein [Candidatus Aegiribacteria sp.]
MSEQELNSNGKTWPQVTTPAESLDNVQGRSGGAKQRTTVGRTSAVRCGRAFNRNLLKFTHSPDILE